MSCYFRHIQDILAEAEVEVTPADKKQVDQVLHRIAGVSYKDCPAAWKALKQQMLADEQKRQDLIDRLSKSVG